MKSLISIEKQIIWRTILALLEDGYEIAVVNGEEVALPLTRDPGIIFAAMRTTNEDYLMVRKHGIVNAGWVRFIYGNDDTEVINDYTMNLEHVMAPILTMINTYEEELS